MKNNRIVIHQEESIKYNRMYNIDNLSNIDNFNYVDVKYVISNKGLDFYTSSIPQLPDSNIHICSKVMNRSVMEINPGYYNNYVHVFVYSKFIENFVDINDKYDIFKLIKEILNYISDKYNYIFMSKVKIDIDIKKYDYMSDESFNLYNLEK